MIRYSPTTYDTQFKTITVSVEALDALGRTDDTPSYIRPGGIPAPDLPWWIQAFHISRYLECIGEIEVDRLARRPVVRLSNNDERQDGRSAVIVVDGLESIAALRDAGVSLVDIEVPWREREEIEARLINRDV